jgi:hypothetical protein
VVVGDQPLPALVGERADRAVRYGLGVGGDRGSGDHGLEPPSYATMEGGEAREVDRLNLAGPQNDMRVARVEPLDLGEHPVVEAQLMDHGGLDLPGELGVQHLVRVSAEVRLGVDTPQEVSAALPAAIEELRLVEQRRAAAHGGCGLACALLKRLARVGSGAVGGQVDVSAARVAQPSELLSLMPLTPLADEVSVWIIGRPRLRTLTAGDGEALLGQVLACEVIRKVGRGEDQRAVGQGEHQVVRRAWESRTLP